MPRASIQGFNERIAKDHPPALLLRGGLNVLRPLGMGGIPVIVATQDRDPLALSSRYCRGYLQLPDPSEPESATVEVLKDVGAELADRAGSRIPLYYGSDDTLSFVSRYREELSRSYLFRLNDPDLAGTLMHKDAFEELARARGLPIPRAFGLSEGGGESVARADFPVLVKPIRKIDWHHSRVFESLFGGKGKARVFPDGNAVLADSELMTYKDQLMVQEYIPGGDRQIHSFHGFAGEDGEVIAWFCGRKIRTYPSIVGESSFLELVKDEGLVETGRRIVRALGLKGVFKIDLKKDPRDGRLFILEVNARFNLWHYLGAVSGVNLPRTAYDHLVRGIAPVSNDYTTRYRWINLTSDRKTFREMRERKEISLAGWLASILRPPKIYDVFSWTDPRPAIKWWGAVLREKLAR